MSSIYRLIASAAVLFFIDSISWADQGCIELEGINLGCVSSIDHSCYLNKAVDKTGEPCRYVAEPKTMYRVEGPIAWNCKSSRNTTICEETGGNGEQSGTNCRTVSECLEYYPPSCTETCTSCFGRIVTENIGISRGCLICTREPCADEKPRLVKSTCPYYNSQGMPYVGSPMTCSGESRCPSTAIPPNGGAPMEVRVNTRTCPAPELPKLPTTPPPMPQLCIWKVDKRSATGCEPIEESNRND